MATSVDGTVTGQVQAVGVTAEDPALAQQHAERMVGTQPAPDATPTGALAYFLGEDGSDAWLASQPTGATPPSAGDPQFGTDPAAAPPTLTPDAAAPAAPAAPGAPADAPAAMSGYLRRAGAEPVVYDDLAQWAADVDSLHMQETTPPVEPTDPATDPNAVPGATPAAPAAPAGPAAAFLAQQQAAKSLTRGSFVQYGEDRGRIDLIVSAGEVPGVDAKVLGTAAVPAARFVAWEKAADGWRPTARKVAAPATALRAIAPLESEGANLAYQAALDMHAAHEAAVEAKALPETASVGPDAVTAVFERGVRSWPGYDASGVGPEDWGLHRTEAFLAKAAGVEVPDYVRDDDLLPGLLTPAAPPSLFD